MWHKTNFHRRRTFERVTHISYACIEVPIVIHHQEIIYEVGSDYNYKFAFVDNNTTVVP